MPSLYDEDVFAIEAEGLEKRYAGLLGRNAKDALRGVDLKVPAGSAFGLIGPNGAGKTTFVKTLLGVVRPTAGRVRLLGADPQDARARARVGYLPERLRLSPAWTPVQILESVARLKGLTVPRARILVLLEEVGIASEARHVVGRFSKGMRQRVGLAVALLGDPELLVLDEPTDGLDPVGRVEVRGILARALARGATLLLNSHLLDETERICERIGILVAGRIVTEGPLDALTAGAGAWRARFAEGAPAAALVQAGFARVDDTTWLYPDGRAAALNEALGSARAAGALVVELTRDARELEQVLADAMGAP
jgi:ABC-2 type transport system ATP-binding protein